MIFDEAEKLKNNLSLTNSVLNQINSASKIAMCRRPFQAGHEDWYPLLRWFKYEPFSDENFWQRIVPKNQDISTDSLYALLINNIVLKRQIMLSEEKITREAIFVELTKEERVLYERCQEKHKLEAHQGYSLGQNLELSRLCCHPTLIFDNADKGKKN